MNDKTKTAVAEPQDWWENETYVGYAVRREDGSIKQLSIRRRDWAPARDWRDFQSLKNQLCGEESEAVEIYPAESRVKDRANWYHLWVLPPGEQFPFGWRR